MSSLNLMLSWVVHKKVLKPRGQGLNFGLVQPCVLEQQRLWWMSTWALVARQRDKYQDNYSYKEKYLLRTMHVFIFDSIPANLFHF